MIKKILTVVTEAQILHWNYTYTRSRIEKTFEAVKYHLHASLFKKSRLYWIGKNLLVLLENMHNNKHIPDETYCKRVFMELEHIHTLLMEIPFQQLSKRELENYGFVRSHNLWLIPLYLFPVIKEGTPIVRIDGKEVLFQPQFIEKNHRSGISFYGFPLKQ